MSALCRECLNPFDGSGRCPACRSPRTIAHPELQTLAIAHLDCDAFYASVEKRDDPRLRDQPVIVGGGRRGVVTTACYIARLRGVRSAMPMFQAMKLCPNAVVVPPRMSHYAAISREIRALMADLTPLVEPLSLDEAFLDLSGTERLHRAPPAVMMARLQAKIEREIGLTVSVGLSHNKFLAKIASDLEKPRGFALIGRAETVGFLGQRPLSLIWGVGASTLRALESEGLRTIAELRDRDRKWLVSRFGSQGDRLWHLSRGEDPRAVSPDRPLKSISHETTFAEDIANPDSLRRRLWDLTEQVSSRAKARGLAGRVVTLKLKRSDFRSLTRRQTLATPSQMAERIYAAARQLLQRDIAQGPFRLIGVGISSLIPAAEADNAADLLDPSDGRRVAAERAIDVVRQRFGENSIQLGRSFE